MAPSCEICNANESKYKCPKCGLRYCSLACYKPHKANHEEGGSTSVSNAQPSEQTSDQPEAQRQAKLDYSDFENDPAFQNLTSRYPMLRYQLQAAYAMTVEPGPEDTRGWTRHPYNLSPAQGGAALNRGSTRGRGRGRGNFGGAHVASDDDRQHGAWSREKGDKEALNVIKKARKVQDETELAEGMREFVELCRMRFGDRQASAD